MDQHTGIVQKGIGRGRELGYPTINVPLLDNSASGIFAARVKVGEEEFEAAAFADGKRKILEAYIFDFDKDLYGWNVTITLLKKIREGMHFKNDDALRVAITGDIKTIREYFQVKP